MSAEAIPLCCFVRSVLVIVVPVIEPMHPIAKHHVYELMEELKDAGCRGDGRTVNDLMHRIKRRLDSEEGHMEGQRQLMGEAA